VLLFGATGITKALGVSITPAITPPYMYHRIVWGGIWGVLFALPFFKRLTLLKGIINSLASTRVQLLVVFPGKANKGFFGYQLGVFTSLFVFIFNAVQEGFIRRLVHLYDGCLSAALHVFLNVRTTREYFKSRQVRQPSRKRKIPVAGKVIIVVVSVIAIIVGGFAIWISSLVKENTHTAIWLADIHSQYQLQDLIM